ncbi:MAG: hypothetical protein LUD48_06975 [Prevotella sp.]|nr:hypothetical protein [Prevotella sp.]
MRNLLLIICLGFLPLLFSCHEEDKPDVAAAVAAKEYYDLLLNGNSGQFVRGMYLPDTVPVSYREQLVANAKMFLENMKNEHGGIYEIRVVNCVNEDIKDIKGETIGRTATAFLVMCFGDSLNEEVAVPMVERNGHWFMK